MKEGLSREFLTLMFQTWLSERGISHISSALRKAQLEARLTVRGWGNGGIVSVHIWKWLSY